MDFETVSPEDFGRSLRGIGMNILVRDVGEELAFLADVFGLKAHRVSRDFAIVPYGAQVFQIHGDHTYGAHPLLSLLPEAGARGAGIEIRLYDSDPDAAVARAEARGAMVLQAATDKPHGLREAFILSDTGYVWVPSRPLQARGSE